MALKRLPYEGLEPLIREHLSIEEDEGTALLCAKLRSARRRGYLRKPELEAVCRWKSARAIAHIRANHDRRVRAITGAALRTRGEQGRMEALLQLQGVSVPMASALLTLLDPKRYGVIDIRVWQLLYATGAVGENQRGVHFTLKNWLQFLAILRHHASRLGVTARDIERAFFAAHRTNQEGTLYERTLGRARR